MQTQQIDDLLAQAVDAGTVPGVVAVAADADGVVYEGAAGALSVDQVGGRETDRMSDLGGADVVPDTMFWIASMTKAVTTVAALRLVEQGLLELDQSVASVRPEFGNLQVLDGFDGDTPRLRPPASPATIRQLLTHTSGVGYWITSPELARFHEVTGTPLVISGEIAALHGTPLVADPGTHWDYGAGPDWVGLVVEAISGRPLDEHLAEFVLGPLGMTDTTFVLSDAQRERLMKVHARTPDGLVALDLAMPPEPDWMAGGHGLHSTAGDYLRFLRALVGGGELDGARILDPETLELMFTDQTGGVECPGFIPSALPELTADIAYPEGMRHAWGAGLHLTLDDVEDRRRAGTGDWAGVANSHYWIDRESGITGALFTQVLPFYDDAVMELSYGFERAIYAG